MTYRKLDVDLPGFAKEVRKLQRNGHTKYSSSKHLQLLYKITYVQAYYRVRKHWKEE